MAGKVTKESITSAKRLREINTDYASRGILSVLGFKYDINRDESVSGNIRIKLGRSRQAFRQEIEIRNGQFSYTGYSKDQELVHTAYIDTVIAAAEELIASK